MAPGKGSAITSWIVGLLAFFLSGASGLVYQMLWIRRFSLVFGVDFFAITTVVAVFMGGLALGSLLAARKADSIPSAARIFRIYAALELAIAAWVLISIPFLDGLAGFYSLLPGWIQHSFPLLTTIHVLLAIVFILPPTTAMGATLPLLARGFIGSLARVGEGVALLYSINTLGATLGCVLTGGVLLETIGMSATLVLAALLNLGAGLLGLLASGFTWKCGPPAVIRVEGRPSESILDTAFAQRWCLYFALAGLVNMAAELLWTRMFTQICQVYDLHAYTAVLGIILLGMGLGSLFGRIVARRWGTVAGVAGLQLAAGIFTLITISPLKVPLLDWLLEGRQGMMLMDAYTGGGVFSPGVAARIILVIAILLAIPAAIMGLAFPLGSKVLVKDPARVGHGVGRLYFYATLGGIMGTFLGGFLILPQLGLVAGIKLCSQINFFLGLMILVVEGRMGKIRRPLLALMILVLLLGQVAMVWIPKDPHLILYPVPRTDERILYYADGINTSTAVMGDRDGKTRTMLVGGHDIGGPWRVGIHVPIILLGRPQRILVVGFASGSNPAQALRAAGSPQVTCVELDQNQLTAAHFFKEFNYGLPDHPRFRLVIDDIRHFLLIDKTRYDLIFIDGFVPTHNVDLFSRDFLQLCRSHLAPGGMVAAKLSDYPQRNFSGAFMRTFTGVFPQVMAWETRRSFFLLLGAERFAPLDYSILKQRLAAEGPLLEDLKEYPALFVNRLLLTPQAAAEFSRPGRIITDDLPIFPDGLWPGERGGILMLLMAQRKKLHQSGALESCFSGMNPTERHQVNEVFDRLDKEMND